MLQANFLVEDIDREEVSLLLRNTWGRMQRKWAVGREHASVICEAASSLVVLMACGLTDHHSHATLAVTILSSSLHSSPWISKQKRDIV